MLRSALTAVECDFSPASKGKEEYDNWIVELSVTGMWARIKIKCKTKKFAKALQEILVEYLLKKPLTYNQIFDNSAK